MQRHMLKAAIISNGMTMKEFAGKLGVCRTTLWRKINNLNMFTLADIRTTVDTLNLSGDEIMDIFFTEKVS